MAFSSFCRANLISSDDIVIQCFSNSILHITICNPDNIKELNKRKLLVANLLPQAFQMYIKHEYFKNSELVIIQKSYKKIVSKLLSLFEDEEIEAAFVIYLNPEFRKRTNFNWSVAGYSLIDFDKDFPNFLKLKLN